MSKDRESSHDESVLITANNTEIPLEINNVFFAPEGKGPGETFDVSRFIKQRGHKITAIDGKYIIFLTHKGISLPPGKWKLMQSDMDASVVYNPGPGNNIRTHVQAEELLIAKLLHDGPDRSCILFRGK